MLLAPHHIAFGFIVYGPENSFYDRLKLLAASGLSVYVYDNSPGIKQTHLVSKALQNCTYITSGDNDGLGVGLEKIASTAQQDGFEGLLFFDQDTDFSLTTLAFVEHFYETNSDFLRSYYSAICFSSQQNKQLGNDGDIEDADLIISSGSLFILQNLKKMHWHNASFFVDGVDYEFCLRSRIYGYRIGRCFNTPDFDHVSEQPDQCFYIFGRAVLLRKYNQKRIKDSLNAYWRLIWKSVTTGQYSYATKFIRSLAIYLSGQILARILLK